jgi:hypothetical protein
MPCAYRSKASNEGITIHTIVEIAQRAIYQLNRRVFWCLGPAIGRGVADTQKSLRARRRRADFERERPAVRRDRVPENREGREAVAAAVKLAAIEGGMPTV